jgi:hypothetical protein
MSTDTKNTVELLKVAQREYEVLTLLQKLLLVRHEIKRLEGLAKELKETETYLESAGLEYLADSEFDSVKIKPFEVIRYQCNCVNCGCINIDTIEVPAATVFKQQSNWARVSAGAGPEAFEALKAAGLGDYIKQTVNANSLSAWFREKLSDDPEFHLPEELAPHISISQGFELRNRKA